MDPLVITLANDVLAVLDREAGPPIAQGGILTLNRAAGGTDVFTWTSAKDHDGWISNPQLPGYIGTINGVSFGLLATGDHLQWWNAGTGAGGPDMVSPLNPVTVASSISAFSGVAYSGAAFSTRLISAQFTPSRRYAPVFKLADLAALKVSVVPADEEETFISRAIEQNDVDIDIAVQKKLSNPENLVELDALMQVVEDVKHLFKQLSARQLPITKGGLIKISSSPLYVPSHLRQKQAFTSVRRITWRVGRTFA